MNREMDLPSTREVGKSNDVPPAPARDTEPVSREDRAFVSRTYAYVLSEAEIKTMWEIGRFRTIPVEDLTRYRYQGNKDQTQQDLQSLQSQGLVQRRSVWGAPQPRTGRGKGDRLTVLVLTKKGKAFLEKNGTFGKDQKIHAGFVKPAEVHHDAAIYRMYQAEAVKIERGGGHIGRVVLDYELKRDVYRPLAKARAKLAPDSADYTRRQAEIAAQNRLKVVDGKILLPDLRIEYDRASGERTHVDLELATRHYRGSSLRGKAEAGFKMYAPQESAAGLASAFDPELAAQIFSF